MALCVSNLLHKVGVEQCFLGDVRVGQDEVAPCPWQVHKCVSGQSIGQAGRPSPDWSMVFFTGPGTPSTMCLGDRVTSKKPFRLRDVKHSAVTRKGRRERPRKTFMKGLMVAGDVGALWALAKAAAPSKRSSFPTMTCISMSHAVSMCHAEFLIGHAVAKNLTAQAAQVEWPHRG